MTDEEMQGVRAKEQDAAADLGGYAAMLQLGRPSAQAKAPGDGALARELAEILRACKPETVYTHNLADKHDTHVGVALRLLEAIRLLPKEERPKKLYGMEVWRGLDWADDGEKVPMDTAPYPELAEKLLSVFASQCAGGKRYDLAALGRRLSNATFFASHSVDDFASCSYALDLTALIENDALQPAAYLERQVELLRADALSRLSRMGAQ
jgi:LmbE family N-acetylglucosaminyl deacetylase